MDSDVSPLLSITITLELGISDYEMSIITLLGIAFIALLILAFGIVFYVLIINIIDILRGLRG